MSATIPRLDATEHPTRPPHAATTAFITAPVGGDTRGVREILERRGIESFTADELDLPGRPLSEILQEGMARADIVVGVLGAGGSADNVFFELGFAQALGKRILVLASGEAPLSGWASPGIPYVRADPSNPHAVEFALDQLLRVGLPPASEGVTVRHTRPLGRTAESLLARLTSASTVNAGEVLEEVVIDALRQTGIETASRSGARQDGTAVAVWSEDFEPWVNNPLLIETRVALNSRADAEAATLGLLRAMGVSGVRWALLIYLHSDVNPAEVIGAPNILAISAEGFLRSLETLSLGELVRKLRNKRVHGVG
jgi:hypothetical protein